MERFRRDDRAEPDCLPVRRYDRASLGSQLIGRHAEALGREPDQDGPHLGGGMKHGRAAVLQGVASGRKAIIRGARRICRDHLDALGRDVELFGRDLRQSGLDALAQLRLAGKYSDAALRIDPDPAVEHRSLLEAAGQLRSRYRLLAAALVLAAALREH